MYLKIFMKKHFLRSYRFIFLFVAFPLLVNAQKSLDPVLKKYNKESIPYIKVLELSKIQDEVFVIDAREREEYETSHLKNAIYVGYEDFKIDNAREHIPKNKKVVVYCSLGVRSEDIAEKLKKEGYSEVYNLYGGIFEWINNDLPVYDKNENKTKKVHAFSKEWGIYLKKGIKVYE